MRVRALICDDIDQALHAMPLRPQVLAADSLLKQREEPSAALLQQVLKWKHGFVCISCIDHICFTTLPSFFCSTTLPSPFFCFTTPLLFFRFTTLPSFFVSPPFPPPFFVLPPSPSLFLFYHPPLIVTMMASCFATSRQQSDLSTCACCKHA